MVRNYEVRGIKKLFLMAYGVILAWVPFWREFLILFGQYTLYYQKRAATM